MKKSAKLLLVLIFTLSLALPAGAAQGGPGRGSGGMGGGPGGMGGASSLSQGMNQGNAPMGGNGFSSQLSSLVTAGTITQTQADAVTAALKPSTSEKPSSSTTSSSTDPASAMKTKLDTLVTAGTITAEQEEAILAAIKPPTNGQDNTANNGQGGAGSNPIQTALDQLVTAGTLTSTLETTVLNAIKPAEGETPGSGSTIESKLAALVTAGTLTSDQEAAILAAIKPANQGQGKTGNQADQNSGHMRLQIGSSTMTVGSSQGQIDPGYNTAPVINNGTTFVPIRAIIESLGGSVTWNSDTQTLTITLDDNTVSLTVGSNTATVNGKSVTLTNDPYISGSGRTMIPLRFIAENLGMQVNWDQNTQSIDIQQ